MDRKDSTLQSASNLNEIIFQLQHNSILSIIPNAKERFWDVVLIDMLINNNDRNEDNWGVIKYKKENNYQLSPIYDCSNCFYGKASDERIAIIMNDEQRLYSSAINGITAYEDDDEKRISILSIIKIVEENNKDAIYRVCDKVKKHLAEIEQFINDLPNSFQDVEVISELRKQYYLKTFKIRLENILEKYCK